MVEIARAYRMSATDLLELGYSCDRCGKSLKVSVLTTSRAWALAAPYGLDESDALRRAEAGAAIALPEAAKALVSLLPCPACRARGFEYNNLWTMSVMIGLGAGAVISMIVWPLSEVFGIHAFLFCSIAAVVIGVPIAILRVRSRCREAERMVEWIVPDAASVAPHSAILPHR
jgi:hypothetical protein